MNTDHQAQAIRTAIRDRLEQVAAELGDLARLSPVETGETGGTTWRLQPTHPDAAPVIWDEHLTDDWTAYLTLGAATEVHVLTSPKRSAAVAADTVAAHLTPVISGDFREELWRSRRTGQPVAAVGWIRDREGGQWRPVGNRSRPLPLLRHLRYDHHVHDYAAYDPPLWDRLPAALHDRGASSDTLRSDVRLMGEAVSELAYPVIQFSRGHLVIVHDDTELRRCTRAGVRNGWYDGLVLVDSSLRRWPATLVGTRVRGVVGWLTGRLTADLELDQPETVELEDVRQLAQEVLQQQADLWDADGQLDLRLDAVRRADDIRQLIGVLQTDDPSGS